MKYLPLVWRNLLRRKTRTTFTIACLFVSFVLYGLLMVVRTAFTLGVDFAGIDRLWVIHKVSIIQMLPVSYTEDIRRTPGVTDVCAATWFGGSYQNEPNQFAVFATDLERYLALYPELKLPPEQLKAALADRQAAIIGKDTAARYGWKIGDRIPIRADIWMPAQGDTWYFNVAGIYDGAKEVDKTQFLFRYDYFDENRRAGKGTVNWFVVRIGDPSQAAQVAARLDAGFANSAAETKTAPEKAVIADFAKQTGDIGAMIAAILAVVMFTILLIAGNTVAQSVRERTNELAVLKTLGFGDATILGLVLAESVLIALVGGGAGVGVIWFLVERGSLNNPFLPVFVFQTHAALLGIGLAAAIGLLAGALPAIAAMRLRITDALRRN